MRARIDIDRWENSMITFCRETRTFYLENDTVSYVFRVTEEGHLEHLWFGGKIGRDDLSYTRGVNRNSCDARLAGAFPLNHMGNELPTYGRGDYREPMVRWTTEGGDSLSELAYVSHRVIPQEKIPGLPTTFGGETLEVTMRDGVSGMEAVLSYTLFPDTAALTRTVRYHNRGNHTLTLDRAYSFSFDLPDNRLDLLTLHGAWGNERAPERTPIRHGVNAIDSKRVSSSAVTNPAMALLRPDATEETGEVWGVNLVYSSSFRLVAEGAQNGTVRVTGGVSDFAFRWVLAPGETFCAPEAVLVWSDRGLGGMSRTFHDTFRNHLMPPRYSKTPRPLVINNWEATYFDFTPDKLCAIIDACAGTGIDTFVLDDGWFGKRNDDDAGLGDWFLNTGKLPGGLTPIIDHCHLRGLKFGLWFEPEMVNPDSDLYRAHPEWAIHCPGHTPCESRHQYVLDLTRADVRDYIVQAVSHILDTHDISYVKWDYNRNVTEMFSEALPPERQGEFAHRYALGLYDLCDRLILTHPHVFFEGCASGGARFDAGVLAYFPQSWTSDDTDAAMRTRIQWGTSLFYPLSSMSCHVSVCPNHQTGRTTPIASRADIAHLGGTGYELDVSRMSEEERAAIPGQVADYRRMEDLVLTGDLFRLCNPYTTPYFAVELTDRAGKRAHLTFMRLLREFNCDGLRLPLRGLDPDARYRIEETGEILHGSTLMRVGLVMPVDRMKDFESLTRHISRVDA